MKRIVVWVITAIGVLVFGAANAQNLFSNPTFDTDASGWTLIGGCSPATFSSQGNPPGSIHLNSCGELGSNPTALQGVGSLDVGGLYRIAWETFFTAGGGVNTFGVLIDGVIMDISDQGTFSWVADFFDFTASAGFHTIGFAAELDPTDVSYLLDNVSLTLLQGSVSGAPEPATLLLLGVGLFGWTMIRRRDARLRLRA